MVLWHVSEQSSTDGEAPPLPIWCLPSSLSELRSCSRKIYPNRRILATKVDYKSAYRRCHLNHKTAVQTITQLPEDNLAIISLRLTFGGTPGPYEWGVISETVCYLANALLHDDNGNPSTLSSPKKLPEKRILSDDIPFGTGRDLIVDIPIDARGTIDCFIDDTIGLTVNIKTRETTNEWRAPPFSPSTQSRGLSTTLNHYHAMIWKLSTN